MSLTQIVTDYLKERGFKVEYYAQSYLCTFGYVPGSIVVMTPAAYWRNRCTDPKKWRGDGYGDEPSRFNDNSDNMLYIELNYLRTVSVIQSNNWDVIEAAINTHIFTLAAHRERWSEHFNYQFS